MNSSTSPTADSQLLVQFSQMYRTAVDNFMDQVGIHRGQGLLLCTVLKSEGLTQSELAEQLSVQGATITNMLQKLEEAGLVIRRRDDADNRLVRVYLTEAGRQKEAEVSRQLVLVEDSLLKGIGEADRAVLRRLIWQIMDNMGGEG